MIPLWLLGIGSRFLSWLPTLLSACLEVLIKPAAWLLLGIAVLGGSIYGGSREKAACARAMQSSIEAARAVDTAAANAARTSMQQQIADRDARLSASDARISQYETELEKRSACSLDDRDLRVLDGVPADRLSGRPKKPAGRK